jgi:hypothetical protein
MARATRSISHDRTFISQRRLQHPPAVVQAAKDICRRDARIGDENLIEMGLVRNLAQGANLDAGLLHRKEEESQALMFWNIPIGARQQHAVVRMSGAGGPDLLPRDGEIVAVALGPGAHASKVGSRRGFTVK